MKILSLLILSIFLVGCGKNAKNAKTDAEFVSECREVIRKEVDFISFTNESKIDVTKRNKGYVMVGGIPYLAKSHDGGQRERWAKCLFSLDNSTPFVAYKGYA